MICNNCKHYKSVGWKHNKPGCSLASTRSTSDGYGPFYESAACVHDQDKPTLKDLFEPILESDQQKAFEQQEAFNKLLEKEREKIRKLEHKIHILIRGDE